MTAFCYHAWGEAHLHGEKPGARMEPWDEREEDHSPAECLRRVQAGSSGWTPSQELEHQAAAAAAVEGVEEPAGRDPTQAARTGEEEELARGGWGREDLVHCRCLLQDMGASLDLCSADDLQRAAQGHAEAHHAAGQKSWVPAEGSAH